MTRWNEEVDVSDLWKEFDGSDRGPEFETFRDAVVARLKASPWHARSEDVQEAVDELADVDDVKYFDLVWSALYDLADEDRVWLGAL